MVFRPKYRFSLVWMLLTVCTSICLFNFALSKNRFSQPGWVHWNYSLFDKLIKFLLTSLSPWTVICFFNDALSVNTFAQDSRWQTNCLGAETLEGLDPGLFFERPVRFPRSWPSPLFGCLRARLFTRVKVFLLVLPNRSLEDFAIPFEFIMAC